MSHAACGTVGRSAATRHAEARGKVKRGGRERERARETQALFLPAACWRSPLAKAKPTRLSHGRHAAARVHAHEHAPTCPTSKLYRGEGGIRRRGKPCSGRVGATAVPRGHLRWAHRRRPRRGRLSAIPTPVARWALTPRWPSGVHPPRQVRPPERLPPPAAAAATVVANRTATVSAAATLAVCGWPCQPAARAPAAPPHAPRRRRLVERREPGHVPRPLRG